MAQPSQTDPQFKLRLPGALKERIERAAAENNRSMNAEIVAALEEKFPLKVSIEEFLDTWMDRLNSLRDRKQQEKLAEEANAFLQAHVHPDFYVWLEKIDENTRYMAVFGNKSGPLIRPALEERIGWFREAEAKK